MIEAAVCFFLISLGVGAWLLVVLGRRIFGQGPPPPPGAEVSFLANLFSSSPDVTVAAPRSEEGPLAERVAARAATEGTAGTEPTH